MYYEIENNFVYGGNKMVYVMFVILIAGLALGIVQSLLALLGAVIGPICYYALVIIACLGDIFKRCIPKWLQIIIIIAIVIAIGKLIIKFLR